ncbi:MAG TPA: hypothetical protein VGG29_16375 [Caulobacteraceae bacterium]
MKTLCRAVLALSLAAAGAGAGSAAWAAGPPFPAPARPGLHRYTYQVAEIVNGKLQHAYRTGFDLETTAAGTEHWAFRLTLDARTGALIEAHTPYDSLDLKAHAAGMPEGASAPVKITRTVSITPR